ncbi:EAL domain-containing protein [Aliivibrio fischeri]|uniref:EAL domain-containing protein n=1 Tax=Aliivibrio fischeri TaxID=668 RepID=UPI0012D8EA7D|nr:EAL domain-containing protein [Aliivibrio fischeri]MUK62159.1 EAL domain-containing protein [Aliivibrio fischeri]MUK70864.1 EAL domain-containing protein [Aliivibrio fischeri]MUK74857.1 EAL domain-containing protein [Aliivibrio fischeri]MUK75967.1 EAL domain-containing protein [Aliivibrio fischeri]MUL21571.1 EAL domain-containing protein [Aliivibrio fischeri]
MKSKINIILVDDVDFSRKVVSFIIKKNFNEQVNIIEAKSCNDVVNILNKKNLIHGIITDIMMPNGDGLDLIKVLSDNNYNIPVAIVSSVKVSILEKVMDLAEVSGVTIVNSYNKPISSEEVISTIEFFNLNRIEDSKMLFEDVKQNDLVELYYQPIINFKTHNVNAVQVSPHWKNQKTSAVAESVFLPDINEMKNTAGFMNLTFTLLERDIRDKFINHDYTFRLNVKDILICDDDFIHHVFEKIDKTTKDKIIVVVEFSDDVSLVDKLTTNLKKLLLAGVRISIELVENDLQCKIIDKGLSLSNICFEYKKNVFHSIDKFKIKYGKDIPIIISNIQKVNQQEKSLEYGFKCLQGDFISSEMKNDKLVNWINDYESEAKNV